MIMQIVEKGFAIEWCWFIVTFPLRTNHLKDHWPPLVDNAYRNAFEMLMW